MPPDRTSKPFKPVRPAGARVSHAAGPATTSRPKPTTSNPRSQTKTQTQARTQSQTQATASSSRSRSRPSHTSISRNQEDPDDDDEDDDNEPPRNTARHIPEDDDDNGGDEDGKRPRIPPPLLTRLLHEFFTDENVRISRGADRAVGKYMETFVREAVARAASERRAADGTGAGGDVFAGGGGFMEVEDLEKLAPQLVLDF